MENSLVKRALAAVHSSQLQWWSLAENLAQVLTTKPFLQSGPTEMSNTYSVIMEQCYWYQVKATPGFNGPTTGFTWERQT